MIQSSTLRRIALSFVGMGAVVATATLAHAGTSLRTYFVGNSLSYAADQPNLEEYASDRGNSLVYGQHFHWGASLEFMWQNPNATSMIRSPYNGFTDALTAYQWDAVTIQPFARPMSGATGDRTMAGNFINLARGRSPNAQFYVYEQWPQREADGSLDFDARWNAQYTGGNDATIRTRDYYEDLTHALRQDFSSLPKSIMLIPAGDVMYELNQRMKNGQVPGYTSINQFYSDDIHPNPIGAYMLSMTFYATLFRQSPVGLEFDPTVISDPAVALQIQDAAWDVVSTHPLAGIVPEPTSIATIGAIMMTALLARRRS